jgi:hypothetical protein
MSWPRVAIAVFAMLHGVGHTLWFLGAWFPRSHVTSDRSWLLPFDVRLTSPVGKAMGLLSLLATGSFLAVGIGLWVGTAWWPGLLLGAATISIVVVVPWGPVAVPASVNAMLANTALLTLLLVPRLGGLTGLG